MAASWRRAASILAACATGAGMAAAIPAVSSAAPAPAPSSTSNCQLANGIKHVIDIQFDNVHLTRDNPNVPSDLEQMPALYDFLKQYGVVLADTHDVLSHTATNFISNQTGLYPDRTAITQSNSGQYYDSSGATHPQVSFAYWTAPVYDYTGANLDTHYNLQYTADRADVPNDTNVNAPAPWVPYTRAGCNVAYVGMANTVLENTAIDVPTVFGANSPQAAEAAANPTKAAADFEGFAIHCAKGASLCASGQPDVLPDEPGGYSGYRGLFGNADIQPVVSPGGPIKALDGSVIADSKGNPGFPGFDSLTPNNSLGYAATLLEHGAQLANIYVSDVHGAHGANSSLGDLGPGEQVYEQQLHDYNTAFAAFFARLQRDGITPANTLFAVTTDEGDHFSGSAPTPAGCTGAPGNYCTYAVKSEVNVNLPGLLASKYGDTTPFAMHSDPAPALWLTGNPDRTDPKVRQLDRELTSLTVTNPLTGGTDHIARQLADRVEEKILHFVSSDPQRTPTLTAFAGEDDYVTSGPPNCSSPCVSTNNAGFAWNHGGTWPDMQDIWAAYAGPGIKSRGIDTSTWTDQVDMRPTILALTGLHDDYPGDGRVLTEITAPSALPPALRTHRGTVETLGRLYKQILATNGQFGADTLTISTRGLASGSPSDDRLYNATEAALTALDAWRDSLADAIGGQLRGAAFGGRPVDSRAARGQIAQAEILLAITHALAHASSHAFAGQLAHARAAARQR